MPRLRNFPKGISSTEKTENQLSNEDLKRANVVHLVVQTIRSALRSAFKPTIILSEIKSTSNFTSKQAKVFRSAVNTDYILIINVVTIVILMFTIFLRISLRSERQLTQTQRRQTTAVNGILVLSFSDGQEGFLPNVQLLVSLSYKRI